MNQKWGMRMSEEKTYIENDIDEYVSWDEWNKDGSDFHPNRKQALEEVLPRDARIHIARTGDWSGELTIIIELEGYIWMHNDYYGTCNLCDGFIDKEKEWTKKTLRKLYCFETISDAIKYVKNSDDYSWYRLKRKTLDLLKKISWQQDGVR